jgi:O-antigen ligase
MGSVYISGKDITDKSVYIFFSRPVDNIEVAWRYGIFRTQSLTYHAYILGLFNLLILTIYFYTEKRANMKIYIPLLSGIISSASRMAYGGLIFLISIQIFRRRKWSIPLLIVGLFILIANINLSGPPAGQRILSLSGLTETGNSDSDNIRTYSRNKSIEVWKDHPDWGVGPGMLGGIVASKYNSYIYEQYNVSNLSYFSSVGGIEQFWFQILAETGIIGVILFINLFFFLFITLYKLREHTISQDMKNLFSGLIVFIPCILIYTIGSGINIAPVLFTYCAFVGIGLGSIDNKRKG